MACSWIAETKSTKSCLVAAERSGSVSSSSMTSAIGPVRVDRGGRAGHLPADPVHLTPAPLVGLLGIDAHAEELVGAAQVGIPSDGVFGSSHRQVGAA